MISKRLRSLGGTSNRDQFGAASHGDGSTAQRLAMGTESFGAPVTVSRFSLLPAYLAAELWEPDFWISSDFRGHAVQLFGIKSTAPPLQRLQCLLCAFHRHGAHHDNRDGILVMIC